jgi:hypothetical protein
MELHPLENRLLNSLDLRVCVVSGFNETLCDDSPFPYLHSGELHPSVDHEVWQNRGRCFCPYIPESKPGSLPESVAPRPICKIY